MILHLLIRLSEIVVVHSDGTHLSIAGKYNYVNDLAIFWYAF